MKTVVVGLAVLAVGLSGLATTPVRAQQQPDPETVVRAWVEAFDSGNIDEFASYLSDDATASGFCRPSGVCNSKAEILAATSAEIAEGVHAEIRRLTVEGNTVIVQLTEAAAAFAELGVERVYIDLAVTVVDGKVTHFDDQFDLTDPQTATFVAALEGDGAAEPSAIPATGDGSAAGVRRSIEWPPIALLVGGVAIVLLGVSRRGRPGARSC